MLKQKMKTKIYRTLTLPVVLYGCETWYLMLKDVLELRVMEKRVLRRINEGNR
jgi:fumarate reductase subunit C